MAWAPQVAEPLRKSYVGAYDFKSHSAASGVAAASGDYQKTWELWRTRGWKSVKEGLTAFRNQIRVSGKWT